MGEQARVDVLAVMDGLVDRYLQNRGTDHQFIACITPNVNGDDAALRKSQVGSAWLDLAEARDAVAELMLKADTAATVLSNLIAARQVDEAYGAYVTDLTAALAHLGGTP